MLEFNPTGEAQFDSVATALTASDYQNAGIAACRIIDAAKTNNDPDIVCRERLKGCSALLLTVDAEITHAFRLFKRNCTARQAMLNNAAIGADLVEEFAPKDSEIGRLSREISLWLNGESQPQARRNLKLWVRKAYPGLTFS